MSSSEGPASSSTVEGTATTPTAFFYLFKLPREIRDMIYALLFSAGDISILSTCREINLEAQLMFYLTVVCHQAAGYCSDDRVYYIPSPSLLVQNFELHCNLDRHVDYSTRRTKQTWRGRYYDTFRPASEFARENVRRNRMIIELDFGAETSSSEVEHTITTLLKRPKNFIGFRVLMVRFPSKPRRWTTADETRIRLVVKNVLEPYLGTAVDNEGEGDDGGCIEFRPWSLMGRQNHRLEPVWFIERAVWDSDGQDGIEEVVDEGYWI